MKLIGTISNVEEIKTSKLDVFLVGLDNLSINYDTFSFKNIKKINMSHEVIVALNKNYHNHELESVKEALISLSDIKVKGVIFCDMAVLNIVKNYDIDINLIYYADHQTTNYQTINFLLNEGCGGAFISSEIVYEDIKDIINKVSNDKLLIVQVFGYQSIFVSERRMVTNYMNKFKLKGNPTSIKKEGKTYLVKDNEAGTVVYSSYVLNALKEALKLKKDNVYFFLNNLGIDNNIYNEIVNIFKSVNEENKNELFTKINSMIPNTDLGFFYKKTVARVKK
jgi:collagenase-like PrtC family protease